MFGFNITDDKKNTTPDGQVFLTNSAPPELVNALEMSIERIKGVVKNSKLPLLNEVCGWMLPLGMIAVFIVGGLASIRGLISVTTIYYIEILLILIWSVLFTLTRNCAKNLEKSDEWKQTKEHADRVVSSIREALLIPPDAMEVDVLLFRYKRKNRKLKPVNNTFYCVACTVYVRDGSLHIVHSFREEWAIPLHNIIGISKTNKRINVLNWNKETPYNKGEYKKYMMTKKRNRIIFKPYYDLLIKRDGEDYRLSIPPYELDALSSMIGLEHFHR